LEIVDEERSNGWGKGRDEKREEWRRAELNGMEGKETKKGKATLLQ